MPSYFSTHLGFKRKDFNIFENTFGKVFDYEYGDIIIKNFKNDDIIDIQKKVFEDVTKSIFIKKINNRDRYVYNTPLGERELCFSGIQFNRHNDEDGYDIEQDLISIEISGRYYPYFIDWECEHGGTTDDGLLNITDKISMITALQNELIKYNPVFKEMQIYIKEDFA